MRVKALIAAAAMLAASPVTATQDEVEKPSASEVVQVHVDAYRSGHLERFVRTFSPDAVVVANGMVARGRYEIREIYRLNFAPGAPGIRIVESGADGDTVYLTVAYTFADGGERCCSYAEYTVKNGKIVHLESRG